MRSNTWLWSRMCLVAVGLVLALGVASCTDSGNSEMDQLDHLAMRLSAKFKRDLDKNDFSLYYIALHPDTIVLEVRYRPAMDQPLLKKIIAAADENARGVARDEFSLRINTKVDSQLYVQEERSQESHKAWERIKDMGVGVADVFRQLFEKTRELFQ